MQTASLHCVKSLSLLLIIVAAVGCAARDGSPQTARPRYVSAYAPHPLNVEPPRHDPGAEATSTWISEPTPHAAHAVPVAPRSPQVRAEPRPRAAGPEPEAAPTSWIDPGAPSPVAVREATAVLVPTQGSHVTGVVRFRDDGDVLDVTASVDGLTGREHAIHVHVYGDCSSADATSAGPHFHFTGSSFDERPRIITGDLGELRPDDRLTTVHRTRVQASLQGRFSILGRSVVVHERGNDPTSPPDGDAGKRLACGVIGVSGPTPAAPATADRRP
jgi:superoxide dismutase, Cu-Zn family